MRYSALNSSAPFAGADSESPAKLSFMSASERRPSESHRRPPYGGGHTMGFAAGGAPFSRHLLLLLLPILPDVPSPVHAKLHIVRDRAMAPARS